MTPAPRGFRSIRTRLMLATTVLIVSIVGSVMVQWARVQRDSIRTHKRQEARALAVALSRSWYGQLYDENWSQLAISEGLLLEDDPSLTYAIVHDRRHDNVIPVAAPRTHDQQYIPDVVPAWITTHALQVGAPREAETWLLTDIAFPPGRLRAHRGERVVEVSADIRDSGGTPIGVLRIGISLRDVDRAVAAAVRQVLVIGSIGLLFGLLGAFLLARWLSNPLRKLQSSASQIAEGDLDHRAEIARGDEIGALAVSFNEMTSALQKSFWRIRRTLASFERFVPGKFLSVIAPDGIENIHVGTAVTRPMTILFSDIRGYTTLSENSTPEDMFRFLNEYLPRMGEAIWNHGGFIDKYIGDAVMALFDDEHTDGALRAALAMRKALHEFNAARHEKGLPTIDTGIGIHRGTVMMGTIGFSSKIESTVIGDAVNLASRVEGLTKTYRAAVLVTGSVVDALKMRTEFTLRVADEAVKVKGKGEAIAVYELVDPDWVPTRTTLPQ